MSIQFKELSAVELAQRAQTLAQKIDEQIDLREQKKENAQGFQIRIDALGREIVKLSSIIQTGEERFEQNLFDSQE